MVGQKVGPLDASMADYLVVQKVVVTVEMLVAPKDCWLVGQLVDL